MKLTAKKESHARDSLQEIKKKTQSFLDDKKNSNNLIDLILTSETDNPEIQVACIKSFHKIFVQAVTSQAMVLNKPPLHQQSLPKGEKYKEWLKERYEDVKLKLLEMLTCQNANTQELALCTLVKFVEAEGHSPLVPISTNQICFPRSLFEPIIDSLLSDKHDLTPLISRFQEYLEYDDARYYTMKVVLGELKDKKKERSDVFLKNVCTILENFTMPREARRGGDKLNHFISKYPESADNLKVNSWKEQKRMFTKMWLEFLKLELPSVLYKSVLLILHDKVIPHMTSPLMLGDFLTDSYNIGGAISLLALNGIFVLVHKYNLDYPHFFKKLYALFEPTVFHVKYRARFFYLSDMFLTSTYIPAYLVAAFVKRLSRLALTAPPSCLTIIVPFICNLLIRHPSCQVMVHRTEGATDMSTDPFDMEEEDPAKCNAMQSSLWEIKSLQTHYHHTISRETNMINQALPDQESDLSSVLERSTDELVDWEVRKKLKTVPTNYEVPQGLFSSKQDPMASFWTLS